MIRLKTVPVRAGEGTVACEGQVGLAEQRRGHLLFVRRGGVGGGGDTVVVYGVVVGTAGTGALSWRL